MILVLFSFVIQTSQLQIDTLKLGSGKVLDYGDTLTVHYEGIIKGQTKPFESSFDKDPITFVVGKEEVIHGWDLGLHGVQKGMELRLTIPPHLAYGEASSDVIPANSTLIFRIHVIGFKTGKRRLYVPKENELKTISSVKYYDFHKGNGKTVTKLSKVTYHYRLFNKFNVLLFNSYEFNPEVIEMNNNDHLIPGFKDGLMGLMVGSKRLLICQGPFNMTDDTFIYEVEIISVN